MKILHIITTINRGGAENHLFELIKGQLDKGHQIYLAYLKGDGYWKPYYEKIGVPVTPLGLKHYGELSPLLKLRRLIQSVNPDIVHSHMPPAELYTRLALLGISSKKLPWVITKHNDEPFYKGIGHQTFGRWVLQRANQIIAISNAVKTYTCGSTGLKCSPDKATVIHYGIEPQPYQQVQDQEIQVTRQAWGVEDRTFLIGTVCRLVPQKSLDTLLKGFAIYLQSTSIPVKLAIIGTGPLESELKKLAEQLNIASRVIWVGFREDIPTVMNALDLFVLSSIYEGFGLVLLEAMATGKPVVATQVSAIPEVIENNITGLLVPPLQPAKLAEAFGFFENLEVRKQFGTAGGQRVKSAFTLSLMIERTLAVYKKYFKSA